MKWYNYKDKWINKNTDELFRAVLTLRTEAQVRDFMRDLLTEAEIIEFGNRWKAARMLSQKIPYSKIEEETGLSSTTVARVSRWLGRGMGGYQSVIKRSNI